MRRRRILIGAAVIILIAIVVFIAVGGPKFIQDMSTTPIKGLPTADGSGNSLQDRYTQTALAKTPATQTFNQDGIQPIAFVNPVRQPQQPSQDLYVSCTVDRGSTPTPTAAQPTTAPTAAATAPALSSTKQAANPADVVFFKIDASASEACYQVGELFFDNNRFNLAVGVTKTIAGEIAIDRSNVSNSQIGDIVINISEFTSDESRRDGIIRRRWLESNKYPYAKLTEAQTVGLPSSPYKEGDVLNFQVVGNLEVHGTKRPTTFNVTASLKGDTLVVHAETNLLMTDFGFQPPTVGGMLKANNEVRLILNLVARKSG